MGMDCWICLRLAQAWRVGLYREGSLLDGEGELLNVWLRLVLNHFVDEGQDVVSLHSEQDEGGARRTVCSRVRSRHATRVNEVLAVVLSDSVLVGMAADEDIAVELSLNASQGLHVAPRDDLVTVNDSDLKVVDLDHFGVGQAWNFVAVPLHNVRLAFRRSQVLQPLDSLSIWGGQTLKEMLTSREPTLPGQITCCIFPGMSRSRNYSGRQEARCGM